MRVNVIQNNGDRFMSILVGCFPERWVGSNEEHKLTLELCASATDAKKDLGAAYYLCWMYDQADDAEIGSLRVQDSRMVYSLRCSSTCLTSP